MNIEELQDDIDTLTDGDELRLMTRHNAADFVRAVAVVVPAARLVADPNIKAAAAVVAKLRQKEHTADHYETDQVWAERIVAAALTPRDD